MAQILYLWYNSKLSCKQIFIYDYIYVHLAFTHTQILYNQWNNGDLSTVKQQYAIVIVLDKLQAPTFTTWLFSSTNLLCKEEIDVWLLANKQVILNSLLILIFNSWKPQQQKLLFKSYTLFYLCYNVNGR